MRLWIDIYVIFKFVIFIFAYKYFYLYIQAKNFLNLLIFMWFYYELIILITQTIDYMEHINKRSNVKKLKMKTFRNHFFLQWVYFPHRGFRQRLYLKAQGRLFCCTRKSTNFPVVLFPHKDDLKNIWLI